jgi:cell division protein FtsB
MPRRRSRRYWSHVVLFAASVLLVNGLFGQRGLLETMRARRAYAAAGEGLVRLRHDNQILRERARRLRTDPRTIEDLARGELGLVGRDEILVTVRDLDRSSR